MAIDMPSLISIKDFISLQQRRDEEYIGALVSLNEDTAEYGLTLSVEEARDLIDTRQRSLRDNGRIETGLGAIVKLVKAFEGSEYLTPENYAETLNELLDIFYYMKTESRDGVSDTELLAVMRDQFDNKYHGSVELMQGRELRYQKKANDLPFEYGIGDGDDDGSNPSDDDDMYMWMKNPERGDE